MSLIPLLHGDKTVRTDNPADFGNDNPNDVQGMPVVTAWARPACSERRQHNKDEGANVNQPFEDPDADADLAITCDCDGGTSTDPQPTIQGVLPNGLMKSVPIYATTAMIGRKLYHYIDYRSNSDRTSNLQQNELYLLYDYSLPNPRQDYLEQNNLLATGSSNQAIVDIVNKLKLTFSGSFGCSSGTNNQGVRPTRFYPYDGAVADTLGDTATPGWLLSRTKPANTNLGEPTTAVTWYINRWPDYESLKQTARLTVADSQASTDIKLRKESPSYPCAMDHSGCERHTQDLHPSVVYFSVLFDKTKFTYAGSEPLAATKRGFTTPTLDAVDASIYSASIAPKWQISEDNVGVLNFALKPFDPDPKNSPTYAYDRSLGDSESCSVTDPCDSNATVPAGIDLVRLTFNCSDCESDGITILYDEGDGLFTTCAPLTKSAESPGHGILTHPAPAVFDEMRGD